MTTARVQLICCAIFVIALARFGTAATPAAGKSDPLLDAMRKECNRSMATFQKQTANTPYFVGYRAVEHRGINLSAEFGALQTQRESHVSYLNVAVRVGDHKLDSAHPLRAAEGSADRPAATLPINNDQEAIRAVIWRETDACYRSAVEQLIKVRNELAVRTAEENPSDDFSVETPHTHIGPRAEFPLDQNEWAGRLRNVSALAKAFPFLNRASVSLNLDLMDRYIVNSEGTTIRTGQPYLRVMIELWAKADDGMDLRQVHIFDTAAPQGLPSEEAMQAKLNELAENLKRLRVAPVVDPFSGPAILSGPAAGVFFHEIFGHRIEGSRLREEGDGQTFAKKVGEAILPPFLTVIDDPTQARRENVDLRGYYDFDDEGVPAQKVMVVENGVMKNFLMCRAPFRTIRTSNGHGRAQDGNDAVSRQGNLMVQAKNPVSGTQLRAMLLAECTRQGKASGLIFEAVEGGFTMTGRMIPNAFNVSPLYVVRVYVDGRPDEVVRGVDLIGTPLTLFSKIIAASDQVGIFNGTCGAESGMIPVSCSSPALLVSEIEVQKKQKATDKPPVLPSPLHEEKKNG